jgi:hypothetical protein
MMNPIIWVCAAVVVLSSLWVAVDAARNQVPTYGDHYDMNTGAFTWFLGCLLLCSRRTGSAAPRCCATEQRSHRSRTKTVL